MISKWNRVLTIVRSGRGVSAAAADEQIVSTAELLKWVKTGAVLGHVLRYRSGRILTARLGAAGRPLTAALILRALCRGACTLEDDTGASRILSVPLLARWAWAAVRESREAPRLLERVNKIVEELENAVDRRAPSTLDMSASPVYLKTDIAFGVRAGGSVGHVAGVVNNLGRFAGPPLLITTDEIPTVSADIETVRVDPSEEFWGRGDYPSLFMNEGFERTARSILNARRVAFVYHRYSLNSYVGCQLAQLKGVPLVVEYNGSELWIGRHWAPPIQHPALAERIELVNLKSADLIVVVSRASRDELVARGIAEGKILVNPNGVDPDVYSPSVDGTVVRDRYGLRGHIVLGFIGTFGPWHGAEVLADAFVKLRRLHPEWHDRARLMLIGDGGRFGATIERLRHGDALGATVTTGLVDQKDGPSYLAACDILISPHVGNPDGSPFFGSPTKLFEYMAMGKGIVASDLAQIGEVLEHQITAWLVPPGDAQALTLGLERLIQDAPLRERLGSGARSVVLERYTWAAHTERIVTALRGVIETRQRPRSDVPRTIQ